MRLKDLFGWLFLNYHGSGEGFAAFMTLVGENTVTVEERSAKISLLENKRLLLRALLYFLDFAVDS